MADGVIQEAANVIAGNSAYGIEIDGLVNHVSRPMPRTRVSGNYIGVGDDGYTPMPNGTGVYINELHAFRLSDRLTIGSHTDRPEERNVISGNEGDGVHIVNSSLCLIRYNILGRGADQEEIAANGGWGINDEAEFDSPAWDSHNTHRHNDADCNMGGNIRIHRPADVEENQVFDGGGVGISVEAPGVLAGRTHLIACESV